MSLNPSPQTKPPSREGFSTNLGIIAATLGSAVGLGNIWKFPYMTGENGGAAFIFVYLICVLLCGLPVMISELIIGRTTHANAVGAFKKLEPKQPWYMIGISGAICALLIMAYYSCVSGWVFSYIFKAASGVLTTTDPSQTTKVFSEATSTIWNPLFWQWLILFFTGSIIVMGVSKGIERITKTLMPILFILLLICDIRALTLPGASEGLKFLFNPDFSKITGAAILTALGLSFFKLSVGMGTMTTYGSYFRDDQNIPSTAFKVMISDTVVSMMAGMAIFPAVFAYGVKADVGPPLLFITIPTVFSSMPLGTFFMILFFTLSSLATVGAMISLIEVPVAYLSEELKFTRTKAAITTVVAIALLGSTATLSFSVFKDTLIAGRNLFDTYGFLTDKILMPVGGLFITLFIAWKWGKKNILEKGSNYGQLDNTSLLTNFYRVVKFVTPIAIIFILLSGFGVF